MLSFLTMLWKIWKYFGQFMSWKLHPWNIKIPTSSYLREKIWGEKVIEWLKLWEEYYPTLPQFYKIQSPNFHLQNINTYVYKRRELLKRVPKSFVTGYMDIIGMVSVCLYIFSGSSW